MKINIPETIRALGPAACAKYLKFIELGDAPSVAEEIVLNQMRRQGRSRRRNGRGHNRKGK